MLDLYLSDLSDFEVIQQARRAPELVERLSTSGDPDWLVRRELQQISGVMVRLGRPYSRERPKDDGPSAGVLNMYVKLLDARDAKARAEFVSVPYRDSSPARAVVDPIPFAVDPDVLDRATQAHARLQNQLAGLCKSCGLTPCSPGPGEPNFDLAWRLSTERVEVVEVKSVTDANESGQLRLGLGQVLDFADGLTRLGFETKPLLAVEREPSDPRWPHICMRHGVRLVWPATFATLFP